MKQLIMLFAAAILLSACTNNGQTEEASAEPNSKTEEASAEPNSKTEEPQTETKSEAAKPDEPDTFIESPQAPDDSHLTEVGKTYTDIDGKIELLAYAPDDQTMTIGPMEVTIKGAKFMNYKPSPDMIDYFHGYTPNETKFNYLKLRVIVKNTSDETLNFAPVSHLETNTGEQKSFEDDFYLEGLHGDFAPGEVRKGQLGFILNETKPEELTSVTVMTSDVFKGKESIEKGQSVTIEF